MHEHVAHVIQVAAGRELVEHLVGDRLACLRQLSQEGDGLAFAQPSEDGDRVLDLDKGFEHWPELRVYSAVAAGKQVFHPLLEHASAALAVSVLPSPFPAGATDVADISARTWPADGLAARIEADQRLGDTALSAWGGVVPH